MNTPQTPPVSSYGSHGFGTFPGLRNVGRLRSHHQGWVGKQRGRPVQQNALCKAEDRGRPRNISHPLRACLDSNSASQAKTFPGSGNSDQEARSFTAQASEHAIGTCQHSPALEVSNGLHGCMKGQSTPHGRWQKLLSADKLDEGLDESGTEEACNSAELPSHQNFREVGSGQGERVLSRAHRTPSSSAKGDSPNGRTSAMCP